MYYVFRVDVWTGAEGSERVRVGFCVPLRGANWTATSVNGWG